MSTQTTDESAEESADNNTDFSIDAVRRRLPSDLTGKQQRVGICLLRNPDAPFTGIGNKCGVSSTTVLNALKGIINEHGLDGDLGKVWSRRGGVRRADSYAELSDKQKAVVDWAARHPGTVEGLNNPEDSLTSEKVATAIEHDDRYDVALHSTYPNKVLKPADYEHAGGYQDLVPERRETLAAKGELGEEAEEEAVESLRTKPPRALLEAAGWDLPESNLDSLEEAEELTEQERLDKAWENGQAEDEEPVTEEDRREHSAPYGCPECGHQEREDFCSKCGTDKRYEWAKEDGATEETADGERDEDLSEELSGTLLQEPEAVEAAIEGLHSRVSDLQATVDTLRSTAVHESEVEEVLGNFEERLQSALDEHREEVNAEVDERLHNSVKRDTLERVDSLRGRIEDMEEYIEEDEDEAPRVMADGHLDANTRLGLVVNELVNLADSGAHVTGMEVKERRHGKAREYVITVDKDGEEGRRLTREDTEDEEAA